MDKNYELISLKKQVRFQLFREKNRDFSSVCRNWCETYVYKIKSLWANYLTAMHHVIEPMHSFLFESLAAVPFDHRSRPISFQKSGQANICCSIVTVGLSLLFLCMIQKTDRQTFSWYQQKHVYTMHDCKYAIGYTQTQHVRCL